MLSEFRWFFRGLYEMFVPLPKPLLRRFNCPECMDTGWASYDDRIGPRTYHVLDHCRACRHRQPAGGGSE